MLKGNILITDVMQPNKRKLYHH
jgi:hypothetical protein